MDKFFELPLPQRLLVVGVVLAVVGGATYYFLLLPVSDQIGDQAKKYKGLMAEYAKLKEYDSNDFRRQIEVERAAAERRKLEYEKMLPREEELPDLIQSIKADADSTGLVVSKFDPIKKREDGPGYRGIPFNVEVSGSYYQFLQFLHALGAPSKRIVNVKNLEIQIGSGEAAAAGGGGGSRGPYVPPMNSGAHTVAYNPSNLGQPDAGPAQLSDSELYALRVNEFEKQSKLVNLQATFIAMAYVYTGQAGGGAAAAPAH